LLTTSDSLMSPNYEGIVQMCTIYFQQLAAKKSKLTKNEREAFEASAISILGKEGFNRLKVNAGKPYPKLSAPSIEEDDDD
jgi:hypothetical protein